MSSIFKAKELAGDLPPAIPGGYHTNPQNVLVCAAIDGVRSDHSKNAILLEKILVCFTQGTKSHIN